MGKGYSGQDMELLLETLSHLCGQKFNVVGGLLSQGKGDDIARVFQQSKSFTCRNSNIVSDAVGEILPESIAQSYFIFYAHKMRFVPDAKA